MKIGLILTAGGIGSRFNSKVPKQFLPLKGKPLFIYTLENLFKAIDFHTIVITYPNNWKNVLLENMNELPFLGKIEFVEGGSERFYSIWNALQKKSLKFSDIIMVHDAVRPFVTKDLLERLINHIKEFDGVIPGIKIKDTLKKVDENGLVSLTINRENIYAIQTPQTFKTNVLLDAYQKSIEEGKTFTDDAGAVEFAGYKVKVVDGSEYNIKITTPRDFEYAEFLLDKAFFNNP